MANVYQFLNVFMKPSRKPSILEQQLIELLINKSSMNIRCNWKESLWVKPMKDGEMGSLLLFPNGKIEENRLFGKCVSEHQFTDKDGVEVIAALNIDNEGELFEIDIWKTDFSPLISLPKELIHTNLIIDD